VALEREQKTADAITRAASLSASIAAMRDSSASRMSRPAAGSAAWAPVNHATGRSGPTRALRALGPAPRGCPAQPTRGNDGSVAVPVPCDFQYCCQAAR